VKIVYVNDLFLKKLSWNDKTNIISCGD